MPTQPRAAAEPAAGSAIKTAAAPEALIGARPLLVLAPHPDDESLGCGALLVHAFAGPGAHIACVTDGGASHRNSAEWPRRRLAALRAGELDEAVALLGGRPRDVTRLGLPDAGLGALATEFDNVAQRLARLALRIGAGTIAATAPSDPHPDHVATATIARQVGELTGLRLLFYPIWSRWRTGGRRAARARQVERRLPLGPLRELKRRAIEAHRSQRGLVIADDPGGFVMEPGFIEFFATEDELYLEERRA